MAALRDQLAELLGPDGLAALSATRGGRDLYVPRTIPPGHWLEEVLGREGAEALVLHYAACRIYVPSRPRAGERTARIVDLRDRGWTVAAIATETGVSERWVRKVLNRARQDRHAT